MAKRIHQSVLIASLLPLCWLGMMIVHEAGHVAAAWATGGTVTHVELPPLGFSRTDVWPNPRPQLVAWAGPVGGVALPLLLWVGWSAARLPGGFLLRFFAAFAAVANAAYLFGGAVEQAGDPGDLLRLGCPAWALWAAGLPMLALGLALWHRQSRHFARDRIRPAAAWVCLGLLVVVVVAELLAVGPV